MDNEQLKTDPVKMELIPFTAEERQVVEEYWTPFLQAIAVIAKLRGLKGNVSVAPDRSGLIIEKIG